MVHRCSSTYPPVPGVLLFPGGCILVDGAARSLTCRLGSMHVPAPSKLGELLPGVQVQIRVGGQDRRTCAARPHVHVKLDVQVQPDGARRRICQSGVVRRRTRIGASRRAGSHDRPSKVTHAWLVFKLSSTSTMHAPCAWRPATLEPRWPCAVPTTRRRPRHHCHSVTLWDGASTTPAAEYSSPG
jgi:hypothetical protein